MLQLTYQDAELDLVNKVVFQLKENTEWSAIISDTLVSVRGERYWFYMNKTRVINDPLGQFHSSTDSDNWFSLSLKSTDGRTDKICDIITATSRNCGLALYIKYCMLNINKCICFRTFKIYSYSVFSYLFVQTRHRPSRLVTIKIKICTYTYVQ